MHTPANTYACQHIHLPTHTPANPYAGQQIQTSAYTYIHTPVNKYIRRPTHTPANTYAGQHIRWSTHTPVNKYIRRLKHTYAGSCANCWGIQHRKLAIAVGASPQRREHFLSLQDGRVAIPVALVYDVKTRWNSTLGMLERALRMREFTKEWIKEYPSFKALWSTPDEWKQVRPLIIPLPLRLFLHHCHRHSHSNSALASFHPPVTHDLILMATGGVYSRGSGSYSILDPLDVEISQRHHTSRIRGLSKHIRPHR